jgi:hypothetical protein
LAAGGGPDAAQAAETGNAHGHGEGGRAGLHDLPGPAPSEVAFRESNKAPDGEIMRRTNVVGIFPNEASIRRLAGAILMEQTEEWTVQRGRYMRMEALTPVCNDVMVSFPAAQRD